MVALLKARKPRESLHPKRNESSEIYHRRGRPWVWAVGRVQQVECGFIQIILNLLSLLKVRVTQGWLDGKEPKKSVNKRWGEKETTKLPFDILVMLV